VVLQVEMARRNDNSASQVRAHTIQRERERESDWRVCFQCDGTRLRLGQLECKPASVC
jgi:hypothetical protein